MAKPTKSTNVIAVIGACLIRYEKQDHKFDETFEVSDEALQTQAFKHLFLTKQIEFSDDSARTKAYIAEIKQKASKDEGKTRAELENGGVI